MSIVTTMTRMWLTRSFKPFQFKNDYDNTLYYKDAKNMGIYIHIPFCEQICDFCPYCKELYRGDTCNEYIDYLIKEINFVGQQNPEKKQVTSLYFGGGTPALVEDRLQEIIEAVDKYFIITEGIGIELHPQNVTVKTLKSLKAVGITRISIGIQSFQDKFLRVLGRKKFEYSQMFSALKEVPFDTVSMDFIFALPGQTFTDIKMDIEKAFSNGANHIAIYPFIQFSFTKSDVNTMKKNEKKALLDEITMYCNSKGYQRESIRTFASEKNAKYSSMTRDNFLGFGCSATTLLNDQFKINTFSIAEYKKRLDSNNLPTSLTLRFTNRQRMVYFLFWNAYSTKVSKEDFRRFFGKELDKYYGLEFWMAKKLGFIKEDNGIYEMTLKGAFYYHYYENYYTLSYIDSMWGIMRNEAFPKEIHF